MDKKLTAKQQMFVLEYMKDLNATQASIRAGYSAKTAYAIGNENLSKPDIVEALATAMAERSERVQVDADWVLKESVELFKSCKDAEDNKTAVQALKLVGTHVGVQAFRENVNLGGGLKVVSMSETDERL